MTSKLVFIQQVYCSEDILISFLLFLQAKHLQFVSGVDAVSFWLATYSWDFINYLLPMVGIVIMFAAFQVESLKNDLGAIVLLLVSTITNLICYYSAAVFAIVVSKLFFCQLKRTLPFLSCTNFFNFIIGVCFGPFELIFFKIVIIAYSLYSIQSVSLVTRSFDVFMSFIFSCSLDCVCCHLST